MSVLRPALAGAMIWLSFGGLPAGAGSSYGARTEHLPEGVGCYWHRGRMYCSRYCYQEIDGFRYCQPRLRDAGSQAPPVLSYEFEPRRYDRVRRGPVVLDDLEPRAYRRDRYKPVK